MEEPGEAILIHPIGLVRNQVKELMLRGWGEVESEIVVEEALAEGLEELEAFSHVMVVFWMHLVPPDARIAKKLHLLGIDDPPLVGIFATRAPNRPNPLGVAVVPLLSRKGNLLRVRGLDAIDGTPVLDLKPHLPPYDAPQDARMPNWVWSR